MSKTYMVLNGNDTPTGECVQADSHDEAYERAVEMFGLGVSVEES